MQWLMFLPYLYGEAFIRRSMKLMKLVFSHFTYLCDGLITRPGESYRLWCVVVYDQETSKMRRLKTATGL